MGQGQGRIKGVKGVKGSKWGLIGGISILGCMVPTTCGAGSGKDQGS